MTLDTWVEEKEGKWKCGVYDPAFPGNPDRGAILDIVFVKMKLPDVNGHPYGAVDTSRNLVMLTNVTREKSDLVKEVASQVLKNYDPGNFKRASYPGVCSG